MGANEQLVSLDMVPKSRSETRSPSPLKRKLDQQTPEQQFVDARATPFTQRKRRQSRSLSSDVESDADAIRAESLSATAVTARPSKALSRQESSQLRNSSATSQLPGSESDSESDDEAPEAISNSKSAKTVQAAEKLRVDALTRLAEIERDRRREKDRKLREQRDKSKQAIPTEHFSSTIIDDEQETPEITRKSLPRLLPDSILNALPEPSSSQISTNNVRPPTSQHKKFDIKQEPATIKKVGSRTIHVLSKQARTLAPKKVASTSNTKSQWLYQRGQHTLNRRPIKKPLV